MKSIFYLLTILFLSLLLSCSEEPPTTVESETLTKKPKPPDPPTALVLESGNTHIIEGNVESIRNKYRSSFRVWTNFNQTPQIREQAGRDISVAIYDNDGVVELLVYNYSVTGKGNRQVVHSDLQIWRHGAIDTPSDTYNLDGFNYVNIIIGELDGNYAGDEIVLAGFNSLLGHSEIRVYNPNYNDFNTPIKSIDTSPYGVWAISAIIGDANNDTHNDIIFTKHGINNIVLWDYNSGFIADYPTPNNERCDKVEVADVDDDGNNEIIWGGALGKIYILEFVGGTFIQEWESEDLAGFIFGLATGNFDGDDEFEIFVGTASRDNPNSICVFDYVEGPNPLEFDYTKTTVATISEMVIDMFAGDMEFVVGTQTSVLAYDYLGGYRELINTDIGVIVENVYLK